MTNQKNETSWALTVLSNEVILSLASGGRPARCPLRLWNDMEIKELAATMGVLRDASCEVLRFYCSGGA